MNEETTVTAEQYHAKVLKNNFARRVADYEDTIAKLQTELQMERQARGALEEQLEQAGSATGVDAEALELPDPSDTPAQ